MLTSLSALSTVAPFATPSACPGVGEFRPRYSESGFGGRRAPVSRELTRPPDRC